MSGQLLLMQLSNDFGYTTIEENIPPAEVEYAVTQHAERMFPRAEHLYYYDASGNFTVDIISNNAFRDRMVYIHGVA
jgi:hypothetical protein